MSATPPSSIQSKASPRKAKKVGGVTLAVDLKVESPKIRKMEKVELQRRGFKWGVALIILICLAVLLKITVRESFLNNPQFSLKQVIVKTEGSLTAQKIVRTSALTTGTNLLTVNMHDLQRRLMQLPQVKSVKIQRDYEGRLTLEVDQRQPVAWLECTKLGLLSGRPDVGCFIDMEGVAFPCEVVTPTYMALPVIKYEAVNSMIHGVAVTDLPIKSALSLIKELSVRVEQDVQELRSIDIHKAYAMTAHFADQSQIIFGVYDLSEQLTRLDRIRLEAKQRNWQIATLNLLVKQNVPVTFRDAPDLKDLLDDPVTAAVNSPTHNKTTTR
jgi:cell division septal protein FtsQ